MKDPLDDDKVKGTSDMRGITANDEYGTNQSNFQTLKNKFESGNIYDSNYGETKFKQGFGGGPEKMAEGPELKDMNIQYPELKKNGYNLTDSSINMGKTFQSNQDFSLMEDSKVIGGKIIGKNVQDFSYLGNKDISAMGLLSQTSSMNDQQKTIINRLGKFQIDNGK